MIFTALSTQASATLVAAFFINGLTLIGIFLVCRRFAKIDYQTNSPVYLSHYMSEIDSDHLRIQPDQILEIPELRNKAATSPESENLLEIPDQVLRQSVALRDDSIIDVTEQEGQMLPTNEQAELVRFQPGVPYWKHHYVYSESEIQHASRDQRTFYFHFRDSFVNGICYDLDGNTNYAFILLFDLVASYNIPIDISILEKHLEILGELYPKTKPYIRSSLFRKMAEIGDHAGIERLRAEQEQNSYLARSSYDYEFWQFGNKHKKRLSLTDDEVKILNRLSYPSNNFLDIQFCYDQVIRFFLVTVKSLSVEYESEGTTLDGCLAEIADIIARKDFRYRLNSPNYKYTIRSISDDFYTFIFKRCENAVRERFDHKRKLNTTFYYSNEAKNAIQEKLVPKVEDAISSHLTRVNLPEEACEIELNAQNTGRWKIAFQKLTDDGLTSERFVEKVKLLADLNKRNPSIENIFFEASKFVSKIDKQAALILYMYYLHYDLRSAKFDNKKLTKTIQKSLFSTNEQLRDFERIISDLITDKDVGKALASVAEIYVTKRKHITLSREAIQEARHKHSDTVELLNEYLHDEFEDEQNAIVAEEISGGEVRIEITSKIDAEPSDTSVTVVDLSQAQAQLLQLFAKSSFSVPHTEVEEFARGRGLFKNQLIESVNEICYEILDDVLIDEEDEYYVINEQYYGMIIQ